MNIRSRTRRAFTLVEIMIVVILFAVMALMAGELYQRGVQAERKIGSKLDLLHRAQLGSLHIARELRHASQIVSPPESASRSRPYVVFVNEMNEIIVLFVNETGQLVKLNRNKNDEVTVLSTGVSRLRVHRAGLRLVDYHVFLEDEATKETFNLISGMCIRNSIH